MGDVLRAGSHEEVEPLLELCKLGQLFGVQEWVAGGHPVNPPPLPTKGQHRRTPLEVAIDTGFHSLVQVLLEAGAVIEPPGHNGVMCRVLDSRRLDLVELLVRNGYDPATVDMQWVFESWEPEIMRYFIERGADVETDWPLARALCGRIRTALGVFRTYRDRFPSFQEQADTALRFHCRDGNEKWVALMLWAGADPESQGVMDPAEEPYEDGGGFTAVESAGFGRCFHVLRMKQFRREPVLRQAFRLGYDRRGRELLEELLAADVDPNDTPEGGCSGIQDLVERVDFGAVFDRRPNLDTPEARLAMESIDLGAKHGAQWVPPDRDALTRARRSLMRIHPKHTVSLVEAMVSNRACSRDVLHDLLRTAAMKRHVAEVKTKLDRLVKSME